MPGQSRDNALDHVIVVLLENRSLDNVLGRLYGPGDGKTFEGVTGKDLTNPIPEWAEHGADRKVVPYAVATDMDSPNPDSGEEYPHTNTQLFNIQNEHNRFKLGEEITSPTTLPNRGRRRPWTATPVHAGQDPGPGDTGVREAEPCRDRGPAPGPQGRPASRAGAACAAELPGHHLPPAGPGRSGPGHRDLTRV